MLYKYVIFKSGDFTMNEEIEILREELNRLTRENTCLHSEEIVKLSQELDKLIYKYYKNMVSA